MTITENSFTGEFSYTLDSKGRLNIPSKFRSALSPDNDSNFVITKGMDRCVVAYPVRSVTRYATTVRLDGQGRIQLTPYLKDYARLDRDVRIIGVVNKIEIWNPDDLENIDELSPEDFEDLSDKVIL